MSIYLISLYEPRQEVWDAIKRNWPDRHRMMTERMALVAPKGTVITQDIGEKVGIVLESENLGLVIEVDNFYGIGKDSDAEWIGKFEDI